MDAPTLVIFARWPAPGLAKTRLIPRFGAAGAAAIYRRLLELTLVAANDSGLKMEMRVTGAPAHQFAETFAFHGRVVGQGEGDLGDRLSRVAGPAIVIGSDCPALDGAALRRAAEILDTHEIVLGPASDGGYYLIGFRETPHDLFAGMPWSTGQVLQTTVSRLRARRIEPALLAELADVDDPDDLADWPELLS